MVDPFTVYLNKTCSKMSKYTVDMMHKAGVNDILQKLKVGVES